MDSREKDEGKLRRKETLALRIGKALDEMDSRNAAECPDGESLAAYAERSLGVEETAKCEGHFATCSRCRKILLVLSASADTPLAEKEVARLGELAAAKAADVPRTRPASALAWPGFGDWRIRWLAPALGVAAVLAVFVALRTNWRGAGRANSELLVAQAPKQELPLPPATSEAVPPPLAPRPQQGRQSPVPEYADRLSSNSPNPPAASSSAEELLKRRDSIGASSDAIGTGAGEGVGAPQDEKKFSELQANREVQPRSAPAPLAGAAGAEVAPRPPDAAQPPAKAAAPNVPAAGAAQLDAAGNATVVPAPGGKQAVIVQEQPSPNPDGGGARGRVSSEARLAERKEQAFALAAPVQKGFAVVRSGSGLVLWRAGANGKIERSTDGGTTWVLQSSPSQEEWLAGAAVSDSVCWLVGRRGAIARTADGEHWQLIAPPPQAAAQRANFADLTGVAAVDAQVATITTSDGRKFATADGGKTWQSQPTK